MKRFLAIVLVLILGMLTLSACGEPKSSPVEDFTYELENGEAIITGYIGTDLEIVVPSVIEERPVTTIESDAFSGYDMKSIYIPDSVLYIEGDAFSNCELLENISLPKTLVYTDFIRTQSATDIWGKVYSDYACYLEDTKWYQQQPDNSVLYLDSVLLGCKGEISSSSVDIKNGTTMIADQAFMYFENINSISIPNTVISIGESAFLGTSIKELHIPSSVKYIGTDDVNDPIGYQIVDKGVVIFGALGSAAEEYAKCYDLSFVAE